MNKQKTITGRLAKTQPVMQDFWPAEKRAALASITFHWLYGAPCNGKDCIVCKAIVELKREAEGFNDDSKT